MTYTIKEEYVNLWGEDATTTTIITDADLEMIARGWEKDPEELKEQLIERDEEDLKELFEGYYNGKRVEIALAFDGRVYITDLETGRSEKWNDESYDEESEGLIYQSLVAEGFTRC